MKVVVSDTNIFIDLISIDLLDSFFKLPIDIHTVDYVINELNISQQEMLKQYNLTIKEYSSSEQSLIVEFHLQSKGNVSFPDCSVWKYAKDNGYTLLTGDKSLRAQATADGLSVSGILFVFDMIVESGILSKKEAAYKLQQLIQINNRLPKKEIEYRITEWSR